MTVRPIAIGNITENLVKFGCMVTEIRGRTDRDMQTRHIEIKTETHSSQYTAHQPWMN